MKNLCSLKGQLQPTASHQALIRLPQQHCSMSCRMSLPETYNVNTVNTQQLKRYLYVSCFCSMLYTMLQFVNRQAQHIAHAAGGFRDAPKFLLLQFHDLTNCIGEPIYALAVRTSCKYEDVHAMHLDIHDVPVCSHVCSCFCVC